MAPPLSPVAAMLIGWWRAAQRRIDLTVLWPACKREAYARREQLPASKEGQRLEWLDYARAAFAAHAYQDPAWLVLGHDNIAARIAGLK
jgi:hypothetical protein